MAARANHIDNYFKIKIESASPMGLIYILYEGAMKSITDGKKDLRQRNRISFNEHITKAQDCIRELRSSLDMERGGDISVLLNNLYTYMINELIESNLERNNPVPFLNRVEKMLQELYETWKIAEKKLNVQKNRELEYQSLSISG